MEVFYKFAKPDDSFFVLFYQFWQIAFGMVKCFIMNKYHKQF